MARKSLSKRDEPSNQLEIGDIVREMEANYTNGTGVNISKYVTIDMFDDINKIEAYLNSKHTTGDTDSLGREKPFFNICVAAANIWYRATVIKLNKIKLRSTKSTDTIDSFLANIHLQDFFRRQRFGAFLSDWGRVLSRYGSAITKFVDTGDALIPGVTAWNRMIVDQINFDKNPQIEVIELTEAELRQRPGYDQDIVDKLCYALQTRRTLDGTTVDTKPGYIKLYEIHMNGKLSLLTGRPKDADIYTQQMQVVSFVASKEQGKFDDFVLYKGREKQSPYYLTHLIAEDGQTLSIGAVKHLFDAQWMMNHSMKAIKDQLDLSSRTIFQTADGNFVGMNAINAIENGDILVHAPNMPLSRINNQAVDTSSYQSFASQWKALSNEITGISESMLGNTAPAGTAWRQIDALLQQNQSLFEVMRDNKALAIEEMARRFMLPFIKRQMDTTKEVSTTLELHDITKVDEAYIKNKTILTANKKLIDAVSKGSFPSPYQHQELTGRISQTIRDSLSSQQGGQRFFAPSEEGDVTWKKQFKDMEWDLEVDSKDEAANDDAMTTLNTMLKTIAMLQGRPMTPDEKTIYNKILTLTGTVSPLELKGAPDQPAAAAAPAAPAGTVPTPQITPQTPNAPQPVT